MNRSKRKQIAEDTLQIIEDGCYTSPTGESISILEATEKAIQETQLFRPEDFDAMDGNEAAHETRVEVHNETTFTGCLALLDGGAERVCCLNFASAKNPGGGFLGGSQAQEEALARASALYPCLNQCSDYYEYHRKGGGSALYSDHMIYSPSVPVFRDDADGLLNRPWVTSIITSPAVNAGALQQNRPELVDKVQSVMRERIRKVLLLAASQGETHLVLGAWGCGVFRNDPAVIAGLFAEALSTTEFQKQFAVVRFSVLDFGSGTPTYSAFAKRFAE